MALVDERGASFSYNNAGSNTLIQVTASPAVLYHLSIYNPGGSVGYLQIYNNGTADASAGTPDLTFPVNSGTAAAGTPSMMSHRDIDFPTTGIALSGGISYLWAAGGTGTAAHGANVAVVIGYRGTATT